MATKTLPLRMASVYAIKLMLIVLLSVSLMLIDTYKAHACSCRAITPSEAFDSADLVFAGQVIDAQTYYYPVPEISRNAVGRDYFSDDVYTFLVSAIWKGKASEISYIISSQNPTSCTGRGFSIGKKYIVYAKSGISVGACSRIVHLESAQEDLRALGAGQPPESGTVASRPWSMDNGCSWEARILAKVGIRHDRDFRRCFEAFASASATSPTPEPTATAAPSPTPTPGSTPTPTPVPATPTPQPEPSPVLSPVTLAAATASAQTPVTTPQLAVVVEEAGTPQWLIPAITAVAGVLAGVLATTLALRRRRGGT